MRRVRQLSTEPSAASSRRLAAALALSAGMHLVLIYGAVFPARSGARTQWTVIQARFQSVPAEPGAVALQSPRPLRTRAAIQTDAWTALMLARPAPAEDAPVHREASAGTGGEIPPDESLPLSPAAYEPSRPAVPDLVHYPAKDLDIYPQAITPITPIYARDTPEAQIAGSVTLLVLIDETGRVVGSSVVDATAGAMLSASALHALANATFHPAQKEGRAVRSQILIKVEFDPAVANAAR